MHVRKCKPFPLPTKSVHHSPDWFTADSGSSEAFSILAKSTLITLKTCRTNNFSYHSTHFLFLFIGREPTTWPANNWLKIVVSCVIPLKYCIAANDTFLTHAFVWKMAVDGLTVIVVKQLSRTSSTLIHYFNETSVPKDPMRSLVSEKDTVSIRCWTEKHLTDHSDENQN